MKVSKTMAYALMAVAAILWATSGTFTQKAIDGGATANQVAVFSCLLSTCILVPMVGMLDRPSLRISKRDIVPLLVFSTVTGSLFSLAWFNTVDLTSVTTAVILLYAYPAIVAVASIFFLNERMTAAKAVALIITFIGAVLVSEAYDLEQVRLNALGIGLGLFTAFAGALYYLWGKKFLHRLTANTLAVYFAILMLPALVLLANPITLFDPSISGSGWVFITLVAIFPSTFGFLISMIALKVIEASKASIVASIEPAAGVLIAVAVLSEAVSQIQAVGVALVVAGVLVLRIPQKDEKDDTAEVPPNR